MNSLYRVASQSGISRDKARKILVSAGYKLNNQKWDNNDDLLLINAFDNPELNPTSMSQLTAQLKRTPYSIFARAEKLGITEPPEHRTATNKTKLEQYVNTLQHKIKVDSVADTLPKPEKPASKTPPRNPSTRYYQKFKGGWETVGEKRIYFRSKWEINYAYYLEWLRSRNEITGWEFEPETFFFEGVRQGHTSYLPDFKVFYPDGTHQWHEVKGWMDSGSRTKLARFAKYYPDEKMVVIDSEAYKQLENTVSHIVPGWKHH